MPVRRREPVMLNPRATKYSARHDYGIDDSISRVGYLSNACLDDTYDAANRSRGRDNELMRNVNAAIVSTEQHISPRAAAVSRRVRASTAPPVSRPVAAVVQPQPVQVIKVAEPLVYRPPPARPFFVMMAPPISSSSYINNNTIVSKPVVQFAEEIPWYLRKARAGSLPPQNNFYSRGAATLPPRPRRPQSVYYHKPADPLPTSRLWAHRPMPMSMRARANSLESVRFAEYDEPVYADIIPSTQLWAHRPAVLRKDAARMARARGRDLSPTRGPSRFARSSSVPRNFERASDYYFSIPDVQERPMYRYAWAYRGRYGPDAKPPRVSLANFPQVYVPWYGPGPSNRSKAAIIGSRMEGASEGRKRKGPRSQFAANKLRELKIGEIENSVYQGAPVYGSLHASRPPLPKMTERKAIRDVDGFTKPRNLLSWQYRVESRLNPEYIIYEPASFVRMRERVKDVQEKMDRQRQLLDRYLDSDFKPADLSSSNYERGTSVKIPAYYAAGGDPNNRPVSDLRRRLRRTIAKTKNNPEYYRD